MSRELQKGSTSSGYQEDGESEGGGCVQRSGGGYDRRHPHLGRPSARYRGERSKARSNGRASLLKTLTGVNESIVIGPFPLAKDAGTGSTAMQVCVSWHGAGFCVHDEEAVEDLPVDGPGVPGASPDQVRQLAGQVAACRISLYGGSGVVGQREDVSLPPCAEVVLAEAYGAKYDCQSIGRIEVEVNHVKRQLRLALLQPGARGWRASVARCDYIGASQKRCRAQLGTLGIPVRPVPRFGSSVAVKTKGWPRAGQRPNLSRP